MVFNIDKNKKCGKIKEYGFLFNWRIFLKPNKKLPLFIVTGASGVGKSTICEILFQNETEYIVMESDLLWHDMYNTPKDNYRKYRELWLRVCANISQIGKPVVLCGCVTPEQFNVCIERDLFAEIYYLAIVCDDDILENRMKDGRKINDENWIKSSIEFNRWIKDNGKDQNMYLLNTTELLPEQVAKETDKWIKEKMNII
jgi:broad-specificity NMP kinase